jgi:hypothetical protein
MVATLSLSLTVFEVNKEIRCYAYISKCLYRTVTMGSRLHPKITVGLFMHLRPLIGTDNREYIVL